MRNLIWLSLLILIVACNSKSPAAPPIVVVDTIIVVDTVRVPDKCDDKNAHVDEKDCE